jgi:hypothetical protein
MALKHVWWQQGKAPAAGADQRVWSGRLSLRPPDIRSSPSLPPGLGSSVEAAPIEASLTYQYMPVATRLVSGPSRAPITVTDQGARGPQPPPQPQPPGLGPCPVPPPRPLAVDENELQLNLCGVQPPSPRAAVPLLGLEPDPDAPAYTRLGLAPLRLGGQSAASALPLSCVPPPPAVEEAVRVIAGAGQKPSGLAPTAEEVLVPLSGGSGSAKRGSGRPAKRARLEEPAEAAPAAPAAPPSAMALAFAKLEFSLASCLNCVSRHTARALSYTCTACAQHDMLSCPGPKAAWDAPMYASAACLTGCFPAVQGSFGHDLVSCSRPLDAAGVKRRREEQQRVRSQAATASAVATPPHEPAPGRGRARGGAAGSRGRERERPGAAGGSRGHSRNAKSAQSNRCACTVL